MKVKGRSLAKNKEAVLQIILSVKIDQGFEKKPPKTCFYIMEMLWHRLHETFSALPHIYTRFVLTIFDMVQ